MTTLTSAAMKTAKGKKHPTKRFTLNYGEKHALREVVSPLAAVHGLKPTGSAICCGARLSKEWCHVVGDELEKLMSLGDDYVLVINSEYVKELRDIHAKLGGILNGTTANTASLELSGEDLAVLAQAGEALSDYENDNVDDILINNNTVSKARCRAVAKFLRGVKSHVTIS